MKNRLPLVLSATALVVALFGSTPLGHAVATVAFANNADKVDGFHASGSPRAHKLVAMNRSANLPTGALPNGTLRGAQVVTSDNSRSGAARQSALVRCPGSKVAVGGGFLVDGALADGTSPVVTGSAPANAGNDPTPFGWTAFAEEQPKSTDADDDWTIQAWVICAVKQ